MNARKYNRRMVSSAPLSWRIGTSSLFLLCQGWQQLDNGHCRSIGSIGQVLDGVHRKLLRAGHHPNLLCGIMIVLRAFLSFYQVSPAPLHSSQTVRKGIDDDTSEEDSFHFPSDKLFYNRCVLSPLKLPGTNQVVRAQFPTIPEMYRQCRRNAVLNRRRSIVHFC